MFATNSIVKIDPPYQGRRFLKYYAMTTPYNSGGNPITYFHFGPHNGPDYIPQANGHPLPIPQGFMISESQVNLPGRYTLSKPAPGDVVGGRRKTRRRR